MKYTLFLLLLAFGTVRGQVTKGTPATWPVLQSRNWAIPPDFIQIKADTIVIEHDDTLEIKMPLHIHFIKIGSEVYQIVEHPATIEKFGGVYIQNNTLKYDDWYRQLIKSIIDSKP